MVDGRLDVVLFTVCELSANLYKFEVRVCLRAARWKHLFHDFWLSLGFSGGHKSTELSEVWCQKCGK